MLMNLLIYRFIILHLVIATALAVAWDRGLISYLYEQDLTRMTYGITAIFLITWLSTLLRIRVVGNGLNAIKTILKRQGPTDPSSETIMFCKLGEEKDQAKSQWLRDMSGWLVMLGLIGTVIGFSVALSGVDQDAMSTASGVQQAMGRLIVGMKIALNTTIVASILGLWNEICQRMLQTASSCFWRDKLLVST